MHITRVHAKSDKIGTMTNNAIRSKTIKQTIKHKWEINKLTYRWSGIVISVLASINDVNLRRTRLVLRWATVSGFSSRCQILIYVTKQPPKAKSAFHPSGVGKWVPASAGKVKAKAGMVHSVSERVPYLSALEVCSRRGAIQTHIYLYLYLTFVGCNS